MKYFKVIASGTLLVANLMAMSPKVFQAVQSGIRPSLVGMRYMPTAVPTEDAKMRCNNCTSSRYCPTVEKGREMGEELKRDVDNPVRFPTIFFGTSLCFGLLMASTGEPQLLLLPSLALAQYAIRKKLPTNDMLLRSDSLAGRTNRRIVWGHRDPRDDVQQRVECVELQQKIAEAQLNKSSK